MVVGEAVDALEGRVVEDGVVVSDPVTPATGVVVGGPTVVLTFCDPSADGGLSPTLFVVVDSFMVETELPFTAVVVDKPFDSPSVGVDVVNWGV